MRVGPGRREKVKKVAEIEGDRRDGTEIPWNTFVHNSFTLFHYSPV